MSRAQSFAAPTDGLRRSGGSAMYDFELVRAAQDGNEAAKELLLQGLRSRVERIAKRRATVHVPAEDLVQDGFVELMKALVRFDVACKVTFWQYAKPSVEGAIKRSSRVRRIIRLPVPMAADIARVHAARNALPTRLGREPTAADLAAELGIPVERVLEVDRRGIDLLLFDEATESSALGQDPYGHRFSGEDAPPRLRVEDVKALLVAYADLLARVLGSRTEVIDGQAAQPSPPGAWAHAWLVDFRSALERMPKRQYMVVELMGLQDLSAKEAASRLGVSERTVYNRWKAGTEWLCAFLNDPDHRLPAERVMYLRNLPLRDPIADFIERYPKVFQRATELDRSEMAEGLEVRWIAGNGWCVSVLAKDHEPDPARSLLEVVVESPPR
jgi:RNA polymerase sigma factor (sigma-70 family)